MVVEGEVDYPEEGCQDHVGGLLLLGLLLFIVIFIVPTLK